jgi:hypothetical protein
MNDSKYSSASGEFWSQTPVATGRMCLMTKATEGLRVVQNIIYQGLTDKHMS